MKMKRFRPNGVRKHLPFFADIGGFDPVYVAVNGKRALVVKGVRVPASVLREAVAIIDALERGEVVE